MNIFHKVALQGLKRNRTRTFVTIIGVILSAALFTAVATFGTSLVNYMIQLEVAKGGNWHVQFSDVDFSHIRKWTGDREITEAAVYQNIGYALLEGAEEQSADKPYLFIAGFDDSAFDALPIDIISGRLPENSSEVLIPEHIAIKAGIRIPLGAALKLAVGQRMGGGMILTQCNPYEEGEALIGTKEQTYTVTGTYARPGYELHSSPGYTLITRTGGQEKEGSYSFLAALKNPRQVHSYAESKREISAYEINDSLLRFMGITENRLFNVLVITVGGVLAAIIMTGSVFLIYNSFHISLNERVHQLGIFMSVGATARQLRGSVLFEGFCIGSVGIPPGILVGIGSVGVLLRIVSEKFAGVLNINNKVPLTLAVSPLALLAAAAVSMATILISAYLPAKKAVSVPVMDCIRQTGEIKTEAKSIRTPRFTWKLYGLEGVLALKNFKRNKKRYRGIVLSLTLSVILVVCGNAFGTTLKRMGEAILVEDADGDILFTTQDMTENDFIRLYDKMKTAEGVEDSTWQTDIFYPAATDELPEDFLAAYRGAMGDGSTGKEQEIILYTMFIADDIYYEFVDSLGLPAGEYSGEEAKFPVCLMNTAEHITYFTGSSMNFTLTSASGEKNRTIGVTFEDSYPLDPVFVAEEGSVYLFVMTAPQSARERFDGMRTADGREHLGAMFWSKTPSQALSAIQNTLIGEGVTADYMLINLASAFGSFRDLNFVVELFTYVFVIMISLIAVANVFHTISTNIRLRRRELVMLRSVGMSDKEFNRMMNFECVFYGMRTLMYGVPIATFLSWLIHKAMTSMEEIDDLAYLFPWAAMLVSIAGVFFIVFITMLYAMSKIRKENIIDALRDEMA